MKQLKERPEITILYNDLTVKVDDGFGFQTFERFMSEYQKVTSRLFLRTLR